MRLEGQPEAGNGHFDNGEHRATYCGDRQAYQKRITFSALGGLFGGEVVRREVRRGTRRKPLYCAVNTGF